MDKQVCAGPLQHRECCAVCAHTKIKAIVLTSALGGSQCLPAVELKSCWMLALMQLGFSLS